MLRQNRLTDSDSVDSVASGFSAPVVLMYNNSANLA